MCGKQRETTAPIQSLVKLQPWSLSLQRKSCLRQNCSLGTCACSEGPALAQNTLIMMIWFTYIGYNYNELVTETFADTCLKFNELQIIMLVISWGTFECNGNGTRAIGLWLMIFTIQPRYLLHHFSVFRNINSINNYKIWRLYQSEVHHCGAGAPVTHRARVRSPVGTSFLGELFSEFFLTCQTNVRKF